jgi:hypothetical protein
MEIKKVVNLIFSLALGFTVYYGFSAYSGSKKMIDYDVAILENKKELQKLDSLELVFSKTSQSVNVQKLLATQKLSAQKDRARINFNKEIGSGVYRRRLIKFYSGLGVLILSSIVWLYLSRKKDDGV